MTVGTTNATGSGGSEPSPRARASAWRRRGRKCAFSFLAIVFVVAVLAGIDRGVGLILTKPPPRSLLFPSGSSIEHESCEFLVSVETSAAGLRDRNFSTERPGHVRFRIAVVGDSFTYGWGVPIERAWPKVLEQALNDTEPEGNSRRQQSKEVLNFGYPGASPVDYIDSAEMAVSYFHPDLLIVALLQGDDLIQLHEDQNRPPPFWNGLGATLFPTASRLLEPAIDPEPMVSYRQTFRLSQQYLRSQFTPSQLERYQSLSPRVRNCFESGRLNPSLVQTAVTNPDYFSEPLTGGPAWRKIASRKLTDALSAIQDRCQNEGCGLMVVIIPYGPYVSQPARAGLREVGFSMPDELLTTDLPDRIVRDVCRSLKIRCVEQTRAFRSLRGEYYFPLDGHFNSAGHKRFAEGLRDEVEQFPRR